MRVFLAVRLHSFGNDDRFACLAGVFALPHVVGSIVIANIGMGRDIWTIAPESISDILKVGLLLLCRALGQETDLWTGCVCEPACLLPVHCLYQVDFLVLLSTYLPTKSSAEVVLHRYWPDGRIRCRLRSNYSVRMLADLR